jgi:hypothetical protein
LLSNDKRYSIEHLFLLALFNQLFIASKAICGLCLLG